MNIYGICLTELKIDYTKVDTFLRSLIDTPARDIIKQYIELMEDRGWEEPNTDPDKATAYASEVDDCLEFYESGGDPGLCAILKDIIRTNEGIDVDCYDPNWSRNDHLGISAKRPWEFNEKTRNLSKEEFDEILTKYIRPFTSDELKIGVHCE